MECHKRIGDYEILDELGRGGMGRVFRVRNVISDRVEAMKVLLPDLVGRQDLAARFLREIKVLAALNHPNIAALRTALTVDNQLVMIMEYVEGQSLAECVAHGPIATADALSYIDQVLDALTYAHGRGVVHRDVKPANMMLTAAGVVKLTDFGIARSTTDETITVAGTTTGSLSYMAPEQVNGEVTDGRSDLYSVGISLYEMVTGRRPFRAENDFHVMLAHLKEEPRPPVELQPSLSPALNGLILRAIAKAPGARFQSADDFRQALRATGAGASAATSARQATVLIPTAGQTATMQNAPWPAVAPHEARATPASDHARTVLDTQTPSAPGTARTHAPPGSAAQPAAARAHHPLLFVALGAALVITALVGTGLYLGQAEAGPDRAGEAPAAAAPPAPGAEAAPPAEPTAAMPDTAPPDAGTVPPSDAPGGVAATPPSPLTVPPAASGEARAAEPAPVRPAAPVPPSAPRATAGPGQSQPPAAGTSPAISMPDAGGDAPAQPAPGPAEPAADAAALDAIEMELDQIAGRAAAVTSSLDRLKEQQARQGLGLRGDMVARQESMRINLSRAQEALDRGDAARAAKLRDAAGRDIEALERFLGR